MSITIHKSLVLSNEAVSSDMHLLVLHSEEIPKETVPGQFVEVACAPDRLLLRRPFSVYDTEESSFSLLVKKVGEGSQWLSKVQVGQHVEIIGPLGHGYSVGQQQNSLLIGGGCGLASLQLLSKRLYKSNVRVDALFGFRFAEDIPFSVMQTFSQTVTELITTAEYGQHPKTGRVSDQLRHLRLAHYDRIYCCGSIQMLKALVPLLPQSITEVSLEAKMACGLGVCFGCTIATQSGGKRVCLDGPVFDMKEVDWDAL